MGLRCNDADVVAVLRERLKAVIVDDVEPAPNISVKMGCKRGRLRDSHLVYCGGLQVRRTFSDDEAIDAALAQVHTFQPPPAGLTPLNVKALERNGRVVLVSDYFVNAIDTQHRRLASAGYVVHLHGPVLADATTGEALLPLGDDLCRPSFRRVPISHVVALAPVDNLPSSPAVRLTHITMLVFGRRSTIRGEDVGALVELTSRVPVVRLNVLEPRAVVRALNKL